MGDDSVVNILYNSAVSKKKAMRFINESTRLYLIQLATMLINSLTVRHPEETEMGWYNLKDRKILSYIDFHTVLLCIHG